MARADPLAAYNAKRDFAATPEPRGEAASAAGDVFLVQKHDATRLHWDLRLEVDGVLKSWAVTKGPSLDPADKRLAVRTEDHPLSYATFEGKIPRGQYGGGTVMLWDRGRWAPIAGKSAADLTEGHLHFMLDGERMKGEWLLVRMKGRPGETRENWLLRKVGDRFADPGHDLVARALTSVATGRSMAQIAAGVEQDADPAPASKTPPQPKRPAKREATLPAFRQPQLATLVDAVPTGNGWLNEIKFDGYRAQVAAAGDRVKIFTRSGLDWTETFQPIADAVEGLRLPPCLLDGEIVAMGPEGNPSFTALRTTLKSENPAPLHLFAFDLLEVDGEDLTGRTTLERKERLEALLAAARPPIHVADHVIGAGEALHRAMCEAGQEGIIAKRADAPYSGGRTRDWVKVKCVRRQEFVVVGWSESTARGRPFASLLLAQHEGDALAYKGKVGTGFDADTLDEVAAKLARIERKTPSALVPKAEARGAHWVSPKLVAEVAFAEFTADDRVRHASFLGLRGDKPAADVVPERPVPAPPPSPVTITSRERVVFPDSGQTKGELADYYVAVAPLLLAHAADRPISLVRCPQGRARKCFFQKHDSGSFGDHVRHVPVPDKDGGGTEDYLYLTDAAGLLRCVQMGTVELHGWMSRVEALERPDRLIFDLDPDEGLGFEEVKRAAVDIRDRLADLGLVSFALLSGGKGIHVIVPLTPGHDWPTHKDFARRFAEALALAEPDRFTATMSKAKRTGRIFVDWLRNQRGATAVVPYSARARTHAPVAAPVEWKELAELDGAARFTIADADTLVRRACAPALAGWGFAGQRLPDV